MAEHWIFVYQEEEQSFTVPEGITAIDVLIVAAGGTGAGGFHQAQIGGAHGGGGAGGVRRVSRMVVVPGQVIPVVVADENAYLIDGSGGRTGQNSSFGPHVAFGGGRGQIKYNNNTNDALATSECSGGSGGGACGASYADIPGNDEFQGGLFTGGSGIAGQGNNGGATSAPHPNAAGGGGAGGSGLGGSVEAAGPGGPGVTLESIGWGDAVGLALPVGGELTVPAAIGGGGGGGTWSEFEEDKAPGGLGGGGAGGFIQFGSTPRSGDDALPYTGGGGGGSSGSPGGGAGGGGIIIIREAVLSETELDCLNVGIDQIVYDLAIRAGIPASRIDVSGISVDSEFGLIFGMGAGRPASARQLIELLQNHSFFDMTEQGGIITASRRDRDPVGLIGGNDLRAHAYGETAPTLCERERTEDYEIPREVRVQYTQALAEYEPGVEGYARRVTDAEGVVDIDLSAIAMEPDEAAVIAEASMLEVIVAREQLNFHLVATPENKLLKAGDITTLDVRGRQDVVRITEIGYAFPGILKIQALRHDPTVYSSDAVGVGRRLIGSIIVNAGPTTFELLDAPLVREHSDISGYFAALGGNPTYPGIIEGWPGGDLERLDGGGWEGIARVLRPGAIFGFAASVLGDGEHTIVTDGQLVLSGVNGILEAATLQEAAFGANLAALEVRSGGTRIGWELIRFLDVAYSPTTEQWTISRLIRGVHGTEWATGLHAIADRFVLLGQDAQITVDATELNLSRPHNAATIGHAADVAMQVSFAWTGVDRIPYAPVHLAAERDSSDDLLLEWTRRDRVGMELQSGQTLPLSEDSEAYEVDIYDTDETTVLRTIAVTDPEATYTAAQQTADFGSLPTELDWDVRQMGALGRGYATRITSEGL